MIACHLENCCTWGAMLPKENILTFTAHMRAFVVPTFQIHLQVKQNTTYVTKMVQMCFVCLFTVPQAFQPQVCLFAFSFGRNLLPVSLVVCSQISGTVGHGSSGCKLLILTPICRLICTQDCYVQNYVSPHNFEIQKMCYSIGPCLKCQA